MSLEILETTTDVIDALGGNRPVAELTGRTAPAVSNWRKFGVFPANTFVILADALEKRGKSAPSALWGMKSPSESESV